MGLKSILKKHKRLMIDTSPIIYFIEESEKYLSVIQGIFEYGKKDGNQLFTSVITLSEVLTQPLKNNRNDLVEKYKNFLLSSDDFTVYSIDPLISEKSALLRARYSIRTPDAIQLAVGIENNATLFVTNDTKLKKIKEIDVFVLQDYNNT
ncbi:MAG TPA: PIN domain-containing protein [Spirochaetota bacterium]|nr:PIN domain-containing protein [Spirochaetota bacterium]